MSKLNDLSLEIGVAVYKAAKGKHEPYIEWQVDNILNDNSVRKAVKKMIVHTIENEEG